MSTSVSAVIRISLALVMLGWAIAFAPDLFNFFGSDGILPREPSYGKNGETGMWSVLGANPSGTVIVAVYIAFLVALVCLLVGFHTRLAALASFAVVLSLTRRTPYIFNSGDALLRNLAFYLILLPGGAAISVDRWRRTRRSGEPFWEFPMRASWPIRLMQIQLTVGYLAAVWAKVGGGTWREGSAVTYALRVGFILRFPLPDFIVDSLLWSNLLGYATLATELALGILVWNKKLRPWLLGLGVAFHLSIDYAVRVGFFSYAMLVMYLAFISGETMDAWVRRTVAWFRRHRRKRPELGPPESEAVVEPEPEVEPTTVVVPASDLEPASSRDAITVAMASEATDVETPVGSVPE